MERFLATDTDHALGTANTINEHALKEAYETVRLQHAPPVVSGADLLDQIEAHTRVLPTGCDSIDAMLEGGCREGQVLELYGDSGNKENTQTKKKEFDFFFPVVSLSTASILSFFSQVPGKRSYA